MDAVLDASKATLPKIEEPSEKINFFHALLLIALNGNFAALAPLATSSTAPTSRRFRRNAPEFNRLADLDFATYDDRPLFQAIDRENEPNKFRNFLVNAVLAFRT